ncbi:MAG: phenylalanine--tRNA ligase subunit beta [Bacteroidales bacterium]
MNISYKWLKKYIDINLTPEQLAEALTSLGLETGSIEEVESIKGGLKGLVVAKVLTCVDHPNSDHLHVTTVDLGDGAPTQIVCGAPNVAAGQHVVVATVGTKLYDGDKEFAIKKSKIRGEESFGMICSEVEIGVGTDHSGITVLPETVHPGTLASEYYNITSDYLLEVDLTPNRVDASSHYGVARDIAAYLTRHGQECNLHRPSVDTFQIEKAEGAVKVTVENSEAAPRYAAVTMRNVTVKESPQWMKDALNIIGLRPINNIVDITNYLLHAMGQPLHCFDVAKIKGEQVIVKSVVAGTKFTTLDGVERELSDRDLMICNAEEPMCIGGVFGGLDSGVTETTTDIMLESAYFNPTWVRKTARRHGLSTDSSFRFERGIDPNNAIYVLKLAALMVKELAGGEICGEIVDIYPTPIPMPKVELEYTHVNNLIGKVIDKDMVKTILKSLEISIDAETETSLSLSIPTYRVDVTRPCDVIEDILRVYGYNNVEISERVHATLSYKSVTDQSNELQALISEQLTAIGFNEILNNSLTAISYYSDLTDYPESNAVKLLNPLSNDLSVMRQTLLFGGLESLSHNINRRIENNKMYEFGNCYKYDSAIETTAEAPLKAYTETSQLALWMTGGKADGNWHDAYKKVTVYDLKANVENIMTRLGINQNDLVINKISNDIYSVALEYSNRGGKVLGTMGIVKQAILKKMDISQEVFYAELNWNVMLKLALKNKVQYKNLPKSQPVKRDLALLIDSSVSFAEIEAVIRKSERKLLRNITLFDVYQGKNIEAGKVSYAVSIILQDDEKTLQEKEIESVMKKIITNLGKELNAQLR